MPDNPDLGPSIREALESATEIKAAEAEGVGSPPGEPSQPSTPPSPAAPIEPAAPEPPRRVEPSSKPRDEKKPPKRDEKKPIVEVKPRLGGQPPSPTGATPTSALPSKPQGEAALPPIRAPQSWTPKERESWAKVPREAQEAVFRREQEMSRGFQEIDSARRSFEPFAKFKEALAPFEAGIRTWAPSLEQGLATLATYENILRSGQQGQKDALFAQLLYNYGGSPEAIAGYLQHLYQNGGGGMPPSPGAPVGGSPLAANGAPVDIRGQIRSAIGEMVEQSVTTQAENEVNAVAQAYESGADFEFLGDVWQDMADYIQMRGAQGVEVSFEDAYDWSCRLNNEVQEILMQRDEAARADDDAARVQAAREASSSVRGTPASPTGEGGGVNPSIRDSINAAYDQHTAR